MASHHDSSHVLTFAAPSELPAWQISGYNLDEMVHSIKPFSREIIRRSRARSRVTKDSRPEFRPLVNGHKCRLGFRFAHLFSIRDDERHEILVKGPPAISQADLECLLFSAIFLPTRPNRSITAHSHPHPHLMSATINFVTPDNHPLSALVLTPTSHTPTTSHPSVVTSIAKPMPTRFLPRGVCTKEASLMITISQCQESPTPSSEYELSRMYSRIPWLLKKLREENYHKHAPVPLGLDARPTLQFTVRFGDTHTLVNVLHLNWATEYPMGTNLIKKPVVNHDLIRLQAFQNALDADFAAKREFSRLTGTRITQSEHVFLNLSPSVQRPVKQLLYSQPIREWDPKRTSAHQVIVRRRIQFRSPLVKVTGPEQLWGYEARPTDMFDPYRPGRGRSGERVPKPRLDERPVQYSLPESSSRFVIPV